MLTADEKRRINDALTKCNGDRKTAAAMLNIETVYLKSVINNNKDLKTLWAKPKNPMLAKLAVVTAQPVEVALETEAQIQARREKEFEKLLTGSTSEGELVQALSLQKAYGRFSEECESLIGGTMVDRGLKLKSLAANLDKRMSDMLAADKLPDEFTSVSILYAEVHKQLSRIMEVVTGSRLARAKSAALREAAKNKKGGKTSFGPKTAILAQNVTVGV